MGTKLLFIGLILVTSIAHSAQVVFSTDFELGIPPEFSNMGVSVVPVEGYAAVSNPGNAFAGDFLRYDAVDLYDVTLTLTNLPPHDSVNLKILLAIIDSWDGTELLEIRVDGQLIFSHWFQLATGDDSSYVPPAGVLLSASSNLGFNSGIYYDRDRAYDLSLDPAFQNIPHTADNLVVTWSMSAVSGSAAENWQGGLDESWAIENVVVEIDSLEPAHTELYSNYGPLNALMTGTPLAVDTNANNRVDTLSLPAEISINSTQIPATATLEKAYLFWGGNQTQTGGALSGIPDSAITLEVPGGASFVVNADTCLGSDGASSTYDIFLCRTDITTDIQANAISLTGSYWVDDYTAPIADESADNASAALVLVYTEPDSPVTQITLLEGLVTLVSNSQILSINDLNIDSPATGELAYYTLEGDTTGSGAEFVTATGHPGNVTLSLSDTANPVDNPMNSTITTSIPPNLSSIGVDIDSFDISVPLSPGDTGVEVEYSAGTDKYWLGPQLLVTAAPPTSTITVLPVSGIIALAVCLASISIRARYL